MIHRFLGPSLYPATKLLLKPIVTEVKLFKERASTVVRSTNPFCIAGDYGIWETTETPLPVSNHYTYIVLT